MSNLYKNIVKYRKNVNMLNVKSNGTPDKKVYNCPLADLLDKKFTRYAAIGDGSCLLHSIFTFQNSYKSLSKIAKEKFIRKLRLQMVEAFSEEPEKVWQLIDNNYQVFIDIREQLEGLFLSYNLINENISLYKFMNIWEMIINFIEKIQRESDGIKLSIRKNRKIIHDKFIEYLVDFFPIDSLLVKAYLMLNVKDRHKLKKKNPVVYKKANELLYMTNLYKIIQLLDSIVEKVFIIFIQNSLINLKDTEEWLGVEQLRFIHQYLNINIFFLRGDNYGVPYIFGLDAGNYYKPRTKNLVILWSGIHYELICIDSKYKFQYDNPIIQKIRFLISNNPINICKKNILLSPFYKGCNSNLSITKIKKIIRNYQKKGVKNINKQLKLLFIKKFKINSEYKSKVIKSNEIDSQWIQTTNSNIENCFGKSSNINFENNIAIEILKENVQVGVCFLNIHTARSSIKQLDNIKLKKNGKYGYLHTLCISEKERGKGICKLYMIKAVKKYSKKMDIKYIVLAVYKNNIGAFKCYQKNGFRILSEFEYNNSSAYLMIYKNS